MAGDDEVAGATLDIRSREGERVGKMKIEEFVEKMIGEYPQGVP